MGKYSKSIKIRICILEDIDAWGKGPPYRKDAWGKGLPYGWFGIHAGNLGCRFDFKSG